MLLADGITKLMNVRYAHRSVGVARSTPAPGPSTVPTVTYLVLKGKPTVGVTSNKNNPLSRKTKTTAKQANAYRNVSVLFIITVVLITCWLPHWLDGVGLHLVRCKTHISS